MPAPPETQRPHHAVWPRRLPYSLTPPKTSLWDNLAISARRYPDKPALVFFDRMLTYPQVLAMAERLAARLHAMGVRKGDRVMLDMQNCPQLIVAHFAILRANAVVVPVNPMNRAEELKHYITDPDAKVAICTGDVAAEIAKADAQLPAEQRLAHLIDKIVGMELAMFIPADLAADLNDAPAGADTVGIAYRLCPTVRLDDFMHHVLAPDNVSGLRGYRRARDGICGLQARSSRSFGGPSR